MVRRARSSLRLLSPQEQRDRGLHALHVRVQYGANELPKEPPPSVWEVARGQLSNPMNIMLLIVAVASFVVGQVPTGVFVLGLVAFNVVMGSSQELKARASVEALAHLQVPQTRNSLARRAEVPFDSEYKFMATFHDRPDWLAGGVLKERHFMTVKGAPDVVVGLCSHALWHGQEISIEEVRKAWTPISSCPPRGCACSRSPHAISTIRRCRQQSTIRWRPCATSSSSRSSASSPEPTCGRRVLFGAR